jgi:hypothetical protein
VILVKLLVPHQLAFTVGFIVHLLSTCTAEVPSVSRPWGYSVTYKSLMSRNTVFEHEPAQPLPNITDASIRAGACQWRCSIRMDTKYSRIARQTLRNRLFQWQRSQTFLLWGSRVNIARRTRPCHLEDYRRTDNCRSMRCWQNARS